MLAVQFFDVTIFRTLAFIISFTTFLLVCVDYHVLFTAYSLGEAVELGNLKQWAGRLIGPFPNSINFDILSASPLTSLVCTGYL